MKPLRRPGQPRLGALVGDIKPVVAEIGRSRPGVRSAGVAAPGDGERDLFQVGPDRRDGPRAGEAGANGGKIRAEDETVANIRRLAGGADRDRPGSGVSIISVPEMMT